MNGKRITILLSALLVCAMLAACAKPGSSISAPVSSPEPLSDSASESSAPASSSEPSSAPVSTSEPEELPELIPVEPLVPDAPEPPPLPDYSEEEAVALAHAGLRAEDVSMGRSSLIKDGTVVAVSFDHVETDGDAMTIFEYTYEIDAKTGKVLNSTVEEFVIDGAPVLVEDTED